MEEAEQDRSEEASPFKKRRAREKGSIARGLDLGFFAALAGLASFIWLNGTLAIRKISFVAAKIFSSVNASDGSGNVYQPLAMAAEAAFSVALHFGGIVFALVLFLEFIQIGPVFSFEPLKPDLKKINPVEGLKRIFSLRILIETLKSILKLLIYGAIALTVILQAIRDSALGIQDGGLLAWELGTVTVKLTLGFAVAALFISAIDQIFSRRDFAKKMRMSRRELKREHKDREGDPRIKQKRREFHAVFLKAAQSLRGARDADVILTNPTHFAVALAYIPAEMDAPRIISMGAGKMAERIKRIGFMHSVLIISDAKLARSLYRAGAMNGSIPDEFFHPVAEIYRSYRILERKNRSFGV